MELALAVTACGELLMTQDTLTDTPNLRSRFDASVDEAEACGQNVVERLRDFVNRVVWTGPLSPRGR